MNLVLSMIDMHPLKTGSVDPAVLAPCIQACFDCAQTCTACADACLSEESPADLRDCIRMNLTCADICLTTGRVLSRLESDRTVLIALLEACRAACAACAEECEKHAGHHAHCRVCAGQCRRCEEACADLLAALQDA